MGKGRCVGTMEIGEREGLEWGREYRDEVMEGWTEGCRGWNKGEEGRGEVREGGGGVRGIERG